MRAATARRWRWRRWLVATVAVIIAVELLYVLAANLFLNTPLSSWAINRKPEKIRVEWDSGWTVVPGIAHIKGIRLRGQQKPVQWYAELEAVSVACQLLSLPTKTFHARWVRGTGLDFRLRQRLDPGEADDHGEAVPPIPGFEDRRRQVPAAAQPPPPNRRNPWTIALDDVAIENVAALWLEQYRFVGEGRLDGAMHFEIRGPLAVDRARLAVRGDLTTGGEPVAERFDLEVAARIESVVPREHKGASFFRFVDATTRLEAPRADLGFLDSYFRGATWLGLAGHGRVDAEITVERGVLATGSRVLADDATFELDYLDYRAEGDGRVEGVVEAGADGPRAVLDAHLAGFELRRRGAPRAHVRGADFTFHATSPDLDLVEPRPAYSIVLDLPPSEITDLAFYNGYLPSSIGLELLAGEATITGHLELSTEHDTGSGVIELRGTGISARFGDLDLAGDLLVATHLANADVEARWFDLSGSRLTVERLSVGAPDRQAGTWWGRFALPAGKVRWAEPLELDLRAAAQVRDSRPIIALLAQKKPLLRWMKPLLRIQGLELGLGLRSAGKTLHVDDLVLTGDGLEIRAELEIANKTPRGFIFIDRGPLSAGLELDRGERDWKLRHARRWYEQQTGRSTREKPDS